MSSLFLRYLPMFTIQVGLMACSVTPPELTPAEPSYPSELEALRAKISEADCSDQGKAAGKCEMSTEPFVVGDVRIDDGSPETVMLVDQLPRLPYSAYRYQNRIAGYYRWTDDGELDETPLAFEAPVLMRELLTRLQSSAFVPAETYQDWAPLLLDKYAWHDRASLLHGSFTFEILVEHLPHHALVLVNVPSFDIGCDVLRDDAAREHARQQYVHVGEQLRMVMRRHNVRYVNYSAGQDLPNLKENWRHVGCPGEMPTDDAFREFLELMHPYYDALFGTSGALTTHAAAPRTYRAEDSPYDRPEPRFMNRTRVGVFSAPESGLDALGKAASYPFEPKPPVGWADIYVNSGVIGLRGQVLAPMPLLKADSLGTDVAPVTPGGATSWAAPLALAYAVSLRESRHAGETFDDALIATLFEEMTPRACDSLPEGKCIFQDPLHNALVEDLRLEYRPPVYVPPAPPAERDTP